MRTRSRHIVSDSAPQVSNLPFVSQVTECNGTVHSPNSGTVSYGYAALTGVYERITDETGLRTPHAVVHRKWTYASDGYKGGTWPRYDVPGSQTLIGTGFDMNQAQAGLFRRALVVYGGWDPTDSSLPAPPGWTIAFPTTPRSVIINDLFDRANGLKADVLLNVVEGNQIWPSLKSLITTLPEIRRNWTQIRKVLKTASGSFLAWKFGVSPILSDLNNIVKYAPDMNRQYKRFRAQKPQKFSVTLYGTASYGRTNILTTTDKTTFQGRLQEAPVARYVLVVKPNLHVATSESFNRLDFAMRRFASSPASLAWEKIPFSFVADWFVDVRGALSGIDSLLGHKPYEVISLTASESYNVASDVFLDRYSPCGGTSVVQTYKATHEYSHYTRNPISGQDILPTWKSRFGKNQAAISAALIAQRLTR